ncbi:MAG: sodium:glutamate symporter [Oscillospiraceae bacterium]|nr:sodium:glutamate symporter [Oscillospiraceae bacterium]
MDFSSSNTALWSFMIQLGVIAGLVLVANLLRRRVPFIKKTLMPTAVLAGFLLLLLRSLGVDIVTSETLEMLTYHGIALGFIALSLRVADAGDAVGVEPLTAPKSGALIVCSYTVQGMAGLIVSLALAYTFMPGMFKASGILLPMGYGQGPGQANNIGSTYEQTYGFVGGRSFGLSLAASGYLVACIVGVIYLNVLVRKKKITRTDVEIESGSVSVDTFQDKGEVPISESVDRLSIQMALVIGVYLVSYLAIAGISKLVAGLGEGVSNTVSTLLWGFNFIVGSAIALLLRAILKSLRKNKIMTRQYQNNYLLSRISGFAFDLMIIAGIGSILISDLKGLWVPFILMSVMGTVITFVFLQWMCKKIYPGYFYEGFLSMYGMMTGTISSGVLLLREVDPLFQTPAANNLITGSGTGILFGIPMLVLVGLAPVSEEMTWLTFALLFVYTALLVLFMLKAGKKARRGRAE